MKTLVQTLVAMTILLASTAACSSADPSVDGDRTEAEADALRVPKHNPAPHKKIALKPKKSRVHHRPMVKVGRKNFHKPALLPGRLPGSNHIGAGYLGYPCSGDSQCASGNVCVNGICGGPAFTGFLNGDQPAPAAPSFGVGAACYAGDTFVCRDASSCDATIGAGQCRACSAAFCCSEFDCQMGLASVCDASSHQCVVPANKAPTPEDPGFCLCGAYPQSTPEGACEAMKCYQENYRACGLAAIPTFDTMNCD